MIFEDCASGFVLNQVLIMPSALHFLHLTHMEDVWMMILVGYVSIEGQTRKIADSIAGEIEAAGERALLFDIASLEEYAVGHPEAAILCAPIHAGKYPTVFRDFVMREVPWLSTVPTSFVSVSLLIASDVEAERQEARGFADHFVEETGWRPAMTHHAAGALRYREYDFFKRWMMQRMARERHAPTDADEDHEFTDWAALKSFVGTFLAAPKA
ncbi:flavodoxin domain-containing protein [Rhizobium sp. AAP43]|uniref:flavodoxin domain-containing protein n=1 Tax=Rhizobium sp. AAP43 TaxID=1523420 RepID=UPI001FD9E4AE|nr:flavodoxin domain-containing protein [Rhizobium sp. AAP43]